MSQGEDFRATKDATGAGRGGRAGKGSRCGAEARGPRGSPVTKPRVRLRGAGWEWGACAGGGARELGPVPSRDYAFGICGGQAPRRA